MNDMQPLLLLLEHHERARDDVLATQRRVHAASAAAQAQTEQLRLYRIEYEQRWTTRFRTDAQVDLLRCYQGFADRLSSAVDQQAEIAARSAAQLRVADAAVLEAELRCASVRRLIERRLVERQRDGERRDRKEADELAARMVRQRLGAAPLTSHDNQALPS